MSDNKKYLIPQTLDDVPKFLWWDIDQALLVITFTGFGMTTGNMAAGAVVGMFCGWLYGRSKAGKHKRFAIHLLYWYLPREFLSFKRTPPSHQREYVG